MCKKFFVLGFLAAFCLITTAQAATIVWISFHEGDDVPSAAAAGAGFSEAPDKGYTALLAANGFDVTRFISTGTPNVNVLNAADLVIISRSVNSAHYQNDAATIWNNVTAPMIITDGYPLRSSRMGYTTGTTMVDITGDVTLTVNDPTHPIFNEIAMTNGTMINPYAGVVVYPTDGTTVGRGISINTDPVDDEGTVLATISAAGNGPAGGMVIAEWQAGASLTHDGGAGTDVLAGHRLVFLNGSREANGISSETAGIYDLLPDGQKVFLNAVYYMLGISPNPGVANNPKPADGKTDVLRDAVLSWTPGQFADKHDVYLGTDFDDVNNADAASPLLVGPAHDANSFEAGRLEFDKEYFWRVDEVNSPPDSTVFKGSVWSFTVEPIAIPILGQNIIATASSQEAGQGPEQTVNGSGLDANDLHSVNTEAMWVTAKSEAGPAWIQYEFDKPYKLHEMLAWNYNGESLLSLLGLKNVTVEYSNDETTWTQVDNIHEFTAAPGTDNYAANTTVEFGGIVAMYVRITCDLNWFGGFVDQYGLSEVRFYYIPVLPHKPKPADGETNVALDTTLSWRAGREAASHDVYFSTDAEAVINESITANSVIDNSLSAGPLDFGRTYYWKVNEINGAEDPNLWEGDIWSFITKEYDDIDNFETYTDNDAAGEAIWQAWVDGYEVPDNGSQVGNIDPPYAERTVTHTGNQSMSLNYNNTAGVAYSEAVKTFPSTRNWTVNGADTLLLYYQGIPVRFAELAPDHIVMSGEGRDIFGTADEFRFAYKQLTGDGTLLARVDSIDNTNEWAKAGVMIRETLDPSSIWASVFSTSENGVRFQARLSTAAGATSDTPVRTDDQIAQSSPVWVRIERLGNQFNGYYSQDGQNWTPMVWNPQTITMSNTVYIGLAVTSHAAGVLCGAEFSEIRFTGNVTGQWQAVDVGIEQASGNSLDTLYVAVEDNAGRKKAVNADPAAIAKGSWTPWPISISDLAAGGVDMTKVKKMYIGVGDRNNPLHGAGKVYIDDIQFGHTAEE